MKYQVIEHYDSNGSFKRTGKRGLTTTQIIRSSPRAVDEKRATRIQNRIDKGIKPKKY